MHKLVIVTAASLLALSGTAFAANSRFGSLQVSADSITVDAHNVLHATGDVVIVNGDTTIKMAKASVSTKDGKTVIKAD